MRIACLIDSLGSGGAERQLTELATGLKDRGHDVSLCNYHSDLPANLFYAPILEKSGVELVNMQLNSVVSKVTKIRSWLKSYRPDIVQAYMLSPSAIAVLTGIGQRKWKVVVSERIIHDYRQKANFRLRAVTQLYRGADWIVSNSHSNLLALLKYLPTLEKKSSVIWNSVDLEKFKLIPKKEVDETFHFICVATMSRRKNAPRLVEAFDLLRKGNKRHFVFRWIGQCNKDNQDDLETMRETMQRVESLGLQKIFTYAGESNSVEYEYRKADALVLVSLNEGLPNVICEGMASGLPIVASAVADIPQIVKEDVNGFLCDPMDVSSIANALQKCLELSENEWTQFSSASRHMAENMFSKKIHIDNYEKLYNYLLNTT